MRRRKFFIGTLVFSLFLLILASQAQLNNVPQPVMSCSKDAFEALGWKDEEFGRAVTIISAEVVPATASPATPEYCKIKGTMWPEIGFEIYLPTQTWNTRFQMTGCGGAAGSIPTSTMLTYLRQNFAVGGTDMGHQGTTFDFTFAYNPPDNSNPNADQKVKDYGYRALHEVTVLAKKAIQAYYGRGPSYSYYNGSSCGGGRGMGNMQRYPNDFDGWVVGMPAFNRWNTMGMLWSAQNAELGAGKIPLTKLNLLASTVMTKCDAIDGVTDGLIEDPRRCPFNALTDLPACPDDVEATNCFTLAQRTAIQKIYEGVKTNKFSLPEQGVCPGSEILYPYGGTAISNWRSYIVGYDGTNPATNVNLGFAMNSYKYMGKLGPDWNWQDSFDYDNDYFNNANSFARVQTAAESVDLRELKRLGKKVILFHGWSDQLIRPLTSVNYYERLMRYMGVDEVKSFFKLYLVPGYGHGTGFGCSLVDWDGALRNWVENGVEPDAMTGTRLASTVMGTPLRTRPICPYPKVAKYKGSGSIEDAANFTCEDPPTAAASGATITSVTSSTSYADLPLPGTNGIPDGYSPVKIVAFTATGVGASADFSVDFGLLPENPVFYKKTKAGTWKLIESCTGVSNVRYASGVLNFTMAPSSECNLSSTAGTITDPIVAGTQSSVPILPGSGGGCFIASATYGSYYHPHVRILQSFRDQYLIAFEPGKAFVRWYYQVSPKIAQVIHSHPYLRSIVKIILLPCVGFSYLALNFGLWVSLTITILLVSVIVVSWVALTKTMPRRKVKA
ncbi:MAG TPA: tannase/feruloyl esterase family alpha/beta hydrolase [Syntrophales bacterium]|nr:tannase/feruloyl esterase family alpha/beta hydrolase [Syntrophales bacterium]HOL59286.1 tannase/feruloyl esterase family alpha/beta hydrolase [Syntrophales bacterium]HPO35336.1 tannase/feruloyl esterase family alpha/beta hydrolase [Syntrophales bacterium]